MINTIGLLSSICFLVGNILSIAYSFDLLIKSIKLHKFASLLIGFIILVVTLLLLIAVFAIANEMVQLNSKYLSNIMVFITFPIAFFACGIKLTKFLWPILNEFEKKLKGIENGATIFELIR